MMNKKLAIVLFFAITTVSTTMFGFFEGLGRATESVAGAPADVATGGRTAEERHERWADQDAARRDARERREMDRYQEKQAREDRQNYSKRYYTGATE